jgi:hypothetical protein
MCCCSCQLVFLFTAHVGSGSFPLSCGVFLPPQLLQAFLLLVVGCVLPLMPSLASLFIYSSVRDSSPPHLALRAPHPLCYMSLLFLLLNTQFLFFSLGGGSVCPGGYADLAQGCLWEYHVPLNSPCPHLPKPSGRRHLAAARGPSWFLHLTLSSLSLLLFSLCQFSKQKC